MSDFSNGPVDRTRHSTENLTPDRWDARYDGSVLAAPKPKTWRRAALEALPVAALVRLATKADVVRATDPVKRELVLALDRWWGASDDVTAFRTMRVAHLGAILAATGSPTSGTKSELIERLVACRFRTYAGARTFASALGLAKQGDWEAFCRGEMYHLGRRPLDVPRRPDRTYGEAWRGWRDFLQGDEVRWRWFEDARTWSRAQLLASAKEWRQLAAGQLIGKRLPRDIPAEPERAYRHTGWNGWADWLGSAGEGRFLPFDRARAFARSLELDGVEQWWAYCRGELAEDTGTKPRNVPSSPHHVYRDQGWAGMGDWLGTGRRKSGEVAWMRFEEARRFAQSLHLRSRKELESWARGDAPHDAEGRRRPGRPERFPASPADVYTRQGTWTSWGDFLGTGNLAPMDQKFVSYEDARRFARELGIRTREQWAAYVRGDLDELPPRPANIPARPSWQYKHRGWKGWPTFLGTGRRSPKRSKPAHNYRPFARARAFARRLGLRTQRQWIAYARGKRPDLPPRPDDIPKDPRTVYSDVFTTMGDWLGTGRKASRHMTYRPFEEARAFARTLGLSKTTDWFRYCRGDIDGLPPLPEDIPVNVRMVYVHDGFTNMGDFVGVERPAFLPFEEARAFARTLGLRKAHHWSKFSRGAYADELGTRPPDIPAQPNVFYRHEGWVSWEDWLGS